MKQILVIHGGSSFSSREAYLENLRNSPVDYDRLKKQARWTDWLSDALPEADVLLPSFPNKDNAEYEEWRIVFEKILPLLTGEVSLVGWSQGAMFLAKYLHENQLPSPVERIILLAPAYDNDEIEDLGSFAVASAVGLEKSAHEVHLLHSEDDPVVPFTELAKFQRDLPSATIHTFTDRNHFLQPTFPELAELLK